MSLSPITTLTGNTSYATSETEKTQPSTTSSPFDKATESLSSLFKHIQESHSLADVKQLRHEITFLRNIALQDRREVLAANQHLTKQELEKLELSELQRGREMEAKIDALMQQATELLNAEVKEQLSLHAQGARAAILPFYKKAQKVLKITSPQTQFERDWDFAKCLYEKGLVSKSITLIKQIPLPGNVQKLFDSIKDSTTPEKLERFFQFAEQEKTSEHIKTVSEELYRPKTLADVLAQPTIMNVFLKYANPVTLMRLNRPYHESVKQVLPSEYAETHAKKALDLHSFSLSAAPVACRNQIPTALAALWQNGLEYQYLDPRLQNDIGIAKIAVVSIMQKGTKADYKKLLSLFPNTIRTELSEFLSEIKGDFRNKSIDLRLLAKNKNIPFLEVLAKNFIQTYPNDKNICRIMVQISGRLLEYTSNSIKDDLEIVTLAVQENWSSIHFAGKQLKDNDALIMTAIKKNAYALQYASERLQADEKFVIEAINQSGYALRYAGKDFKDNKEIVRIAVTQDWNALSVASERLQDDEELVTIALQQSGYALEFASNRLRDDTKIVSMAITQNAAALYYASERLQDNEEIVTAAVKKYGEALQCASERLRDNADIVLEAVQQKGRLLLLASERLKDNEEIVLAAMKQDEQALQFASERIQKKLKK